MQPSQATISPSRKTGLQNCTSFWCIAATYGSLMMKTSPGSMLSYFSRKYSMAIAPV